MKQTNSTFSLKVYLLNKYHIYIFGSILLAQIIIYFIVFHKEPFTYFPAKNDINIKVYNDSTDKGNSTIEQYNISDSCVSINFILKKGFVRPYVGISLSQLPGKYIDLSKYNKVIINAQGHNINNIVVYLVTKNNSAPINNKTNDLYFSSNIELKGVAKDYILSLDLFKIPDWWYDNNNLSPNMPLTPDWSRFTQINLTTGLMPEVDTAREFEVNSISFIKDNASVILKMSLIQLFVIIILIGVSLFKRNRAKKSKPITINYIPVTVNEKTKNNSFLDYINANFNDSKLSLEKVIKNTNVSQRVITDHITENFNCNFKTYINQIRISEAKRLLKETDLNMSEIAFKVGFSSPSHFNRVFKTLTGLNPSEFLQTKDL